MFSVRLQGCKELQSKLQKAESGLMEHVTKDMNRACILVENQVKLNVSGGVKLPMEGGGWRSQPYLHVRGNKLRGSYAHKVEIHGFEIIGRVGSALIYAPVHEFGAHIVAKAKPYLTFPIKVMGALTKSGKMRSRNAWVRVKEVTIPARHPLRYAGQLKKQEIINTIGANFGRYMKGKGL